MRRLLPVISVALLLFAPLARAADSYDPLAVSQDFKANSVDLDVIDQNRNRTIPMRVYLPDSKNPAPVVLFSHGLGGSRRNNPYLGNHWSARGYAVVFVQHIGSDESVWRGKRPAEAIRDLKSAASPANFKLRVEDIPAVIDQLERWNKDATSPLSNRLDLEHVGMSGHSFGAVTTQAVSGQTYPRGIRFTDKRIDAAIAMSPQPARIDPDQAFGAVKIPWLLMTGTQDDSPIGDVKAADRLQVFPHLAGGAKYQLVLDGAAHLAFGEIPQGAGLQIRKASRQNPNHHRAILATSTAFWDAFLKGNSDARNWLENRARSVLEEQDVWETK